MGDWLQVLQGEGATGAIVVVAVAGVTGDLEIVDHDEALHPVGEDDLHLIPQGQVLAPVGVQVEKHGATWEPPDPAREL